MANNDYKVIVRRLVFSKGPISVADCKIQMKDGQQISRQILEHQGSVVMIPKVGKDRYLMIRQFRYAARSWIWEWPAGGVEQGESLRQAAQRELAEEIGLWPKKIRKVISFYPSPGVSEEVMHLFLAEELIPKQMEKDEDEVIEVHSFTLAQIGKMIRAGEVIDGKTLLGYFYLKEMFA